MNLIFVSAGLTRPKKSNSRVARRHRYLNYGLLSLANAPAVSPGSVYHGHFDQPEETLKLVLQGIDPNAATTLLLSCPSFLALDWSRRFVECAKASLPNARIIFGGRWVVDGNVERLKAMLPGVHRFVEGIGEARLPEILKEEADIHYCLAPHAQSAFITHSLSCLDYAKLHRPEEFIPSFEVSRGCGAGCAFCAESRVRMTGMKPAALLATEIRDYQMAVTTPVDRFYLESSLFVPRRDWIDAWQAQRASSDLKHLRWRTEGRVDMFASRNVGPLAEAGLRVLDLGLESGSPLQLRRMRKTTNPEEYLRRSEILLAEAAAAGILTKVNILLFPGETHETLAQTLSWLERNAKHITGISVYPTVYYGFKEVDCPLWNYYKSLGATAVSQNYVIGTTMMNLSRQLSAEETLEWSDKTASAFMTERDYFSLKSFSYFDPSYTYEQYAHDLQLDRGDAQARRSNVDLSMLASSLAR